MKSGPGRILVALLATVLLLPAAASAKTEFPVAAGKSFRDRGWAPEMVVVPGGSFVMGSTEAETTREGRNPKYAAYEHPQAQVTVATLAVGKFDVTRGDYARFVRETGRPIPAECNIVTNGKWGVVAGKSFKDVGFVQTDRHPVACVVWDDAQAYAAWLSAKTGHHYRLLHETEWEYAARGGTTTTRWWGDGRDDLCAHANGADRSFDTVMPGEADTNRTCDDHYAFTSPVGHFPPNAFGLYDMLGNLWQWSADCFSETLPVDAATASAPATCEHRSIRGGSWHNYPSALRVANRFWLPADMRSSSLGFRVARLPD